MGNLAPVLFTDFSAGEFSPKMQGRYDLPVYNHGAKELFNFVPFFPGGATKRPGFKHLGASASSTGNVVLHALTISQTFSYLLEFGAGYVRFWRNGALVLDEGVPIQFATPWNDAQIQDLRFAQDDRSLYIASGSTSVRILSMSAVDEFTFTELTLTARAGQLPFQGTGNYPRAIAFFDGRLYLACTDNEPTTIWASKPFEYGNFTYYETVTSTTSKMRNPLNEIIADVSSGSGIVYISDADTLALLKVGDKVTGEYIVEKDALTFVGKTAINSSTITQVSSSVVALLEAGEILTGNTIPEADVLTASGNSITIDGVATADNNLATFKRDARYSYITEKASDHIVISIPATGSKNGAKLYAGWHDPTVPEYADDVQTRDVYTASSAFKKTLASDQAERICWLAAGRDLVVGTTTGERVIANGTTTANFACKRQTAIAASTVAPFMLNESILYLEGSRRAVQSYVYSADTESYDSTPVAALSDHILKAQAHVMDYQNTPAPIAWFGLDDGTIAGLAYCKALGIQAWFRVAHASGAIKSLAVIPTATYDELYVAVKRGTTTYIEQMDTLFDGTAYLDSSAPVTVAAGAITGLSWIPNGTATIAWGDGLSADVTVTGGAATVPGGVTNGTTVLAGLKYTARIGLMPVAINQMRLKTVPKIVAKVLDCYPFTVSYPGRAAERANWTGKRTSDEMILVNGVWDTDGSIQIEQAEPVETTILAVMVETQQGG